MAVNEQGYEFREDLDRLSIHFPVREHPLFSIYCDIFGEYLAHEVEFSFAPDKTYLEMTIEGRGVDFHSRIKAFLDAAAVSSSHRDAYDLVNTFYPDVGTLLKVEFQKGAASAPVSIYYQTQVSAKLAAVISSLTGSAGFPVELFAEIGKHLHRKGIFLGIDLDAEAGDTPPALAVFCLIAPRKAKTGLLTGLSSVFELLELGKTHQETLEKYHNVLIEHIVSDLFVSFLFRNRLCRLVKIDYDKTGLPGAVKIMREMGTPDEELRRVVRIAQALEARILNYFGMKYGDMETLSFKLYFKRVYKACGDDDVERFARFLESTIWRFDDGSDL
ncbi:MAG: hypothetical protein AB9903_18350 [Vulcanimicrobiota bacterium]